MVKLAIIGDTEIKHYSVADRLWELISVVIDQKIKCNITPLATPTEALAAFETFKKDRSCIGLEIFPPWREVLSEWVDKLEDVANPPAIELAYKDASGVIVGANTSPRAVQRALESEINLYKCKSVLVIGTNNSGLSLARHLCDNLDKATYLYDPLAPAQLQSKGVVLLASLDRLTERKYDLIINMTPLGRYYFNKQVEAFTSPLDLDTLSSITHKDTIVQETNHLPTTTLLLQMAGHLQLKVVTGGLTLVYEAVESLGHYFGISLDQNTVRMLVEEINIHIAEREATILAQGT